MNVAFCYSNTPDLDFAQRPMCRGFFPYTLVIWGGGTECKQNKSRGVHQALVVDVASWTLLHLSLSCFATMRRTPSQATHFHEALVPHGRPKCNRVSPPRETKWIFLSLKDNYLGHIVPMMESCPIHLPSSCSFLREVFSSDFIKVTTPYILYTFSPLRVVRTSELSKYASGLMNRTH